MKVRICTGKGGVGKTTNTVSLAIYLSSQGEKTAVIDYDGGHSVGNALGLEQTLKKNILQEVQQNLSVIVIENFDFTPIFLIKARDEGLEKYLEQFPNELGIIPLADMVNAFFGVPTDVATLQKFVILIMALEKLEAEGYQNVIIDVEPTAGFERLMTGATALVRSLRNLKETGFIHLAFLKAKWPDIAGWLKGDYVKNVEKYCQQIERTVKSIKEAYYYIVCIPEYGPIMQMYDIEKIVKKFDGVVQGFIVNNMRGEPFEEQNLRLLRRKWSVLKLPRRDELHKHHVSAEVRRQILMEMGQQIAQAFSDVR